MRFNYFEMNLVDSIKKEISSDSAKLILSFMDEYYTEDGRIRYSFKDDKTSFIPWEKIKIGDVILVEDHDDPNSLFNYARIDHKYRECIFTTWIDGIHKNEHHMFFRNSWLGLNGSFPSKIIAPKEVLLIGFEMVKKLEIQYI